MTVSYNDRTHKRIGISTARRYVRPDPKDQITCRRTSLKSISGVIFSKPRLSNGKTADVQMDVQVPIGSKRRPLVVYVTGGRNKVGTHENNLWFSGDYASCMGWHDHGWCGDQWLN